MVDSFNLYFKRLKMTRSIVGWNKKSSCWLTSTREEHTLGENICLGTIPRKVFEQMYQLT